MRGCSEESRFPLASPPPPPPPFVGFFGVFLVLLGFFLLCFHLGRGEGGGRRLRCGLGGFFFFPLRLEVGGAGKPSALGLRDDTVGCKGSPVGFGEAGGGLALRVRPWPRRLLRSVKVFPSPPPPTSPAAHGGVQGGGGGGTGFFFKILQVWDNLQPAAPWRAGG